MDSCKLMMEVQKTLLRRIMRFCHIKDVLTDVIVAYLFMDSLLDMILFYLAALFVPKLFLHKMSLL